LEQDAREKNRLRNPLQWAFPPPNQWLIIYTDQGALLSLLNFMQHKDNLQEWLRTIASAPDEAERAALILKIKREYELWLP
jgi:hypothetical protein